MNFVKITCKFIGNISFAVLSEADGASTQLKLCRRITSISFRLTEKPKRLALLR